MILRGLLDQSLGGFVCVRGYAPLGALARASHADMGYQRDLISTHRETVIRFLHNRRDLFFPEIILSCALKYDFVKSRSISGLAPLGNILEGKRFVSNVDGIAVAVRTLDFRGIEDVRASTKLEIASITIPDELLAPEKPPVADELSSAEKSSLAHELLTPEKSPLFRIDGNHRLSAADEDAESRDIVAPFCIILFDAGVEERRNSKTIFHNINSKSIPLTSEQNLKIILDDDVLFPDDVLKEPTSFGWAFYLARKTRAAAGPERLAALKDVLSNPRTVLVELFKLLLDRNAIIESEESIQVALKCLNEVHAIYNIDDDLRANHCVGLFLAFFYFCVTDPSEKRLKSFRHWVAGNHLTALNNIDAGALIEIFERVHLAKRRTIFVSMQFGDDTKAIFDTIKKTIDQINKEARPHIKIEPLRIDTLIKGHSFTITDEILTAIEDSGLLIADLTYGNKNVYHEVGYLMGLNRGRGVKQENFVLIVRNQSEEQIEKDVGFNLKGVSQIRFKETINLEMELTETIKRFYGLP
jgi:hypothetical protein